MDGNVQDVYEPLEAYKTVFKEKFAKLAKEKFLELARKSGVDVKANRAQAAKVRKLEEEKASAARWRTFHGVMLALSAAAVLGLAFLAANAQGTPNFAKFAALAAAAAAAAVFFFCKYRKQKKIATRLAEVAAKEKGVAWRQMKPLNDLFTWDLTPRLIEATVPRLKFDPYFSAARLDDLRRSYGWNNAFNDGKSILFSQSGEINGNAFVFAKYLEMEWGEMEYEGRKTISWTEWEEDENGKSRAVTRYETLVARITRPYPYYHERKVLLYGNDAAPNLSFTHEPSGLEGDGFFNSMKKSMRLKGLKKFSENLDDDSNFTLMANHEFETWFHAKDRDHEVEFRLLFTPLAQQQMLAIMKDTEVGFGDDFVFRKEKRMNALCSKHLDETEIDTDPAQLRHWDYDACANTFLKFNTAYFRSVYFSMAPLLAIPLYQQTRTHEDIWKSVNGKRPPLSFWEHEANANFLGENAFRHPDCVTRSILKTEPAGEVDGECAVKVKAHGHRGIPHVEYESVYGKDGCWHRVPVEWTEYVPVTGAGTMCASAEETPSGDFCGKIEAARHSAFRRSVYSYVGAR